MESAKAAKSPTGITATSDLDTCAGAGTALRSTVLDFVGSWRQGRKGQIFLGSQVPRFCLNQFLTSSKGDLLCKLMLTTLLLGGMIDKIMLSGVKMRMELCLCSLFIGYNEHALQWDNVGEQEIGREGIQIGLLWVQVSYSDNLHDLSDNLQLNFCFTV